MIRVRPARWLAPLLFAAASLASCPAFAQASTDYVDQTDGSGQRVVFKDDPLGADGNASTGATIVVRPRAARVGLLRPRVHFIPEMLKSVENL